MLRSRRLEIFENYHFRIIHWTKHLQMLTCTYNFFFLFCSLRRRYLTNKSPVVYSVWNHCLDWCRVSLIILKFYKALCLIWNVTQSLNTSNFLDITSWIWKTNDTLIFIFMINALNTISSLTKKVWLYRCKIRKINKTIEY